MHYEIYIDVVFHKSPDRLHIDQIYRNIIPMWKKQKRALLGAAAGAVFSCWIIYLRSFLKSGIFFRHLSCCMVAVLQECL